MTKKIIRLCYRKVIDAASQKTWDKFVFESSYAEFLMQSQLYNAEKKHNSFAELIQQVPGAERLHFLVSTSIIGYLKQLDEVIPEIVNNIGQHFLKFKNYRFEIINSSINDRSKHQVAINFYSEPLVWHETIGENLLLSALSEEKISDGVLTNLVQLRPFLSIYSVKEVEE